MFAALSALGFAFVACSSNPPRTESQAQQRPKQDALSQERVSDEDTTAIQTQRQVVVTQKKKVDIPSVTTTRTKGDLNRMEENHFEAIGVPAGLAKRIIEYREEHGDFKSLEELKNVRGMDARWFTYLNQRLAVRTS